MPIEDLDTFGALVAAASRPDARAARRIVLDLLRDAVAHRERVRPDDPELPRLREWYVTLADLDLAVEG